jgi:hypothetical protein
LPFLLFPSFFAPFTWQFQLGYLLWYVLMGAMIGMTGALGPYPIIQFSPPWWLRGLWQGAILNGILALFIWQDLARYQSGIFGADSILASPVWFIIEGAVFGLILDFCATKIGGEGPQTITNSLE